jgi:hypothetical protein
VFTIPLWYEKPVDINVKGQFKRLYHREIYQLAKYNTFNLFVHELEYPFVVMKQDKPDNSEESIIKHLLRVLFYVEDLEATKIHELQQFLDELRMVGIVKESYINIV